MTQATTHGLLESVRAPGLIWGYDCCPDRVVSLSPEVLVDAPAAPTSGFRWLHLNLADQRTLRWLADSAGLPPYVVELLLASEGQPRYQIADGSFCAILSDICKEFETDEVEVGTIRIYLGENIIISARNHPVRCADGVRARLLSGVRPTDAASALEILFSAMSEVHRTAAAAVEDTVLEMETDFLKDQPPPSAKLFLNLRSNLARFRRVLSNMRILVQRLDDETLLPAPLITPLTRFASRISTIEADVTSIHGQLRRLREDVDLEANQKTNENLYMLSILSALLLPATLVTGIFGMNTGGFPWASHPLGTFYAILMAGAASIGVYLLLRLFGYLQR